MEMHILRDTVPNF